MNAILWLLGCAMTEDRFERRGIERWCVQAHNCDDQVDVDACVDTMRSTDRSGCVYDPEAAASCYEALIEVTCLEMGLGVRVIEVPPSCARTWICGEGA